MFASSSPTEDSAFALSPPIASSLSNTAHSSLSDHQDAWYRPIDHGDDGNSADSDNVNSAEVKKEMEEDVEDLRLLCHHERTL